MSTALSIAEPGFPRPNSLLNLFEWQGTAVSPEAQAVTRGTSAVVDELERSQALFGEKAAAISRMRKLAAECSEENWDGDGAAAIDAGALVRAELFVRALPSEVPLPEFAPEPDGAISLDWIVAPTRLFSLSVGARDRLAYAWVDGTDTGHAVARFSGQEIPFRVLEGIRGILNRP